LLVTNIPSGYSEGHTIIQWPKREQAIVDKSLHMKLNIEQHKDQGSMQVLRKVKLFMIHLCLSQSWYDYYYGYINSLISIVNTCVRQRNSTSITRNDIICIKLQKSTTWEHHHFTKRKIWAYKTISTPPLLWSTCAKPWKWAVMYMCVSGIDFSSFYEFLLDFGTVPTAWYFLFFMLLLLVAYWHYIIIIGGILTLYYYYWWHIDIVLLLLVAHWHCIIIIGGILTLYYYYWWHTDIVYYYWWHTDIVLLLLVAYWHCIIIIGGILTSYYYYWWHTDIVLLLLVAYWHCIIIISGQKLILQRPLHFIIQYYADIHHQYIIEYNVSMPLIIIIQCQYATNNNNTMSVCHQ
jgi:hypothetical protein